MNKHLLYEERSCGQCESITSLKQNWWKYFGNKTLRVFENFKQCPQNQALFCKRGIKNYSHQPKKGFPKIFHQLCQYGHHSPGFISLLIVNVFLAIFDMQNTTQMMYNIFIQHVCSWKANSSQWILAKLRFFHTNYTFFTLSGIYFCRKTFNKRLQINQAQCSFDPSTAGY